jgi:hypothetical protein
MDDTPLIWGHGLEGLLTPGFYCLFSHAVCQLAKLSLTSGSKSLDIDDQGDIVPQLFADD